jgi:transcriptional regulator with XRE-family HTH domain
LAHWQAAQANHTNPSLPKSQIFPTRKNRNSKKDCKFDKNCPDCIFKKNKEMTIKESFGEHIRKLREENGLPLRKVAAVLDIDPSTLSKIERGERSANKEMIPLLAELFKEDIETLGLILLSDKVAYDLRDEENSNEILKVAEEKIKYLKNKSLQQGKIDFDKQ